LTKCKYFTAQKSIRNQNKSIIKVTNAQHIIDVIHLKKQKMFEIKWPQAKHNYATFPNYKT